MLLITILVMTVATTIALSLIGRATTDLSMSNQLTESSRAFNAAEAGVEEILKTGENHKALVLSPGVQFDVTRSDIGGGAGVYQMLHKTPKGVTETLWMVDHDATGAIVESPPAFTSNTLNICWSMESVHPALVVAVLYKEGTDGTYKVARVPLDFNAASHGDNFISAVTSPNGCGLTNYYQRQITFSSLGITLGLAAGDDTLIALRIRPEYADTNIAVDPLGVSIPKQGNQIVSNGTTDTGITRRVVVYQQYRSASSIFDSAIYSQAGFGHN